MKKQVIELANPRLSLSELTEKSLLFLCFLLEAIFNIENEI